MFDQVVSERFVERWSGSRGHERAVYQQFFVELCDLLGVPKPDPSVGASPDYRFEKPVTITHDDGRETTRFIDFYKRGHFLIEAKQGSEAGDAAIGTARRGTATWDKAMRKAFGQALQYAHYLPEGRPPFLITCDIGHMFEVWTAFSGDYGGYGARRSVGLADLTKPEVHDFLVKVFTDPWALDPSKYAAKVTREVAAHLAELARSLEADGHDPELVAQFLMRCIFTMFAEDVGLLPENLFTGAIERKWLREPRTFGFGVVQLWKAMNEGLPFAFEPKLLRFNGGLFAFNQALLLNADQLKMLLEAAKCDWSSVEPAIFGTLVERALDDRERERLGAHFTPREYIERLVRPAVIEPIRSEWEIVQAEVHQILDRGDAEPTDADRRKAVKAIRDFHAGLCKTRILDPACGSGNFLYVTLDLLKEVEAEVVRELQDLGEKQSALEMEGLMVNPGQFLGIELNPRAREIAELVLWIGYLQWYRRTYGRHTPEPVLRQYRNIVRGDAVLASDGELPRLDGDGKPVRVWDMRTTKKHPVTGKEVPDETARAPVMDPVNPRPAKWPEADYIVSNPPFVGNKMMRKALGDGYTEALRKTYPKVAATADLVMYWWEKAAELVRAGKVKRFGFITTNSITQAFNRKVLETHVGAKTNPLAVVWAIPDHPWVDAGADVRIAMTVGVRATDLAGKPVLGRVTIEEKERSKEPQARRVDVAYETVPKVHPDLSGGADVAGAVPLRANQGLSFMGMTLVGKGFRVTQDEVRALGYDPDDLPRVIRPHMIARELTQKKGHRFVLDLFGLTAEESRSRYPSLYQWLLDRVKPERDQNKDPGPRRKWWLFGRSRPDLRAALLGLQRYIITPETAKHRFFVFAPMDLIPDHQLYAVCIDDAWVVGMLSSRAHLTWAAAEGTGATLEDRPRWRNNKCFDPFPFPDATEAQKGRIRDLGERLDAHRKKVQADHPDVTLTGMYNSLERLRALDRGEGQPLSETERTFHDRALIGVLKSLHDDIDKAVAEAYGWPADLCDDEILSRLVTLNAERVKEEAEGHVRWLRPDSQCPDEAATKGSPKTQQTLAGMEEPPETQGGAAMVTPWPRTVPDQLKAVRDLLAARSGTWTAGQVAAAFKAARKASVQHHLETLEALGVLVGYDGDDERRWNLR